MSLLSSDRPEAQLYVYAGLPGAGKTEVANMAVAEAGGSYHSLSDILRDMAPEGTEGHELGELSTKYRSSYGPAYLVERFIGRCNRRGVRAPAHLDSIRCVEELQALREAFGSTLRFVYVKAPFDTRFDRVKGRGRAGEEGFDRLDMESRDARERSWGVSDLPDEADRVLVNDGSEEELQEKVDEVVNH